MWKRVCPIPSYQETQFGTSLKEHPKQNRVGKFVLYIRHISQKNGGDEGIRTLDGLMTHTPLAGERLRPLGHVSVGGTSDFTPTLQPLMHRITALPQLQNLLTINSRKMTRHKTMDTIGRAVCMRNKVMSVYGIFPSCVYTPQKTGGLNANTRHKRCGACCALARK